MFAIIKDWLKACQMRLTLTKVAFGAFGTYYKMLNSTMGIKILHSTTLFDNVYPQCTLKIAAFNELTRLKQLYDRFPDLFPKPGEIVNIPMFGIGYSMEHIPLPYAPLYEMRYTSVNIDLVITQIRQDLLDNGINHVDLHSSNILYNPQTGNFKIIDADPCMILDMKG